MSIAKPFTFTSNTFAKSSEVNADFDLVYSQVNTNISNIAQNATDIENLNTNKANINGNASKTFAVANPVNNSDAVNKSYLLGSIANSLDYISGLVITKSSSNTIIVSAGSCYDSDKTVLLKLNNNTSKTNSSQSANSTYYVYITSANASGAPVDITISQSSSTPGTTKYRKIGYYKTDGDGNISSIYAYGVDANTAHAQSIVTETYVDGTDWYRVYSDGWCEQGGITAGGSAVTKNVTLLKPYANTDYNVVFGVSYTSATSASPAVKTSTKATGSFDIFDSGTTTLYTYWRTCGYIN